MTMAKIPQFKSDRETAQFWDTHSLADFEDELRPAKDVAFVKPDRQVISLRLDRKIVRSIKTLAAQKGIGYSSLLRMWVLEDFQREMHAPHKVG
jgi:predicted DNA binding CopG/RHH family protein